MTVLRIMIFVTIALVFYSPPTSVFAACSPACGSGQICLCANPDPTLGTCAEFSCYVAPTTGSNTTDCEDDTGSCSSDYDVVASRASNKTFSNWVNGLIPLVDGAIIPLLYAVAFLAFLIGVVRYFFTEGEEGRKTARQYVVWGLVGLVVLFSVWSLVKLLIGILEGDI